MTDRLIPEPTGTVTDTTRVRSVMTPRHRETQPQLNQALLDTVPGVGSGDQ
jgi:hypothetical protein